MRAHLLVLATLLFPPVGSAAEPGTAPQRRPSAGPAASPEGALLLEDALAPGAELTGREIYERVLENQFDSYIQKASLFSGDRAGSEQESRLRMTWKSYRDDGGRPTQGVLSKTMVKYTHPYDLRFSGYLIVNNDARVNDQFVYLPSRRRIRRVNLRGEAIFGTDFSFEDIVPREVEDATYRRLSNEQVEGTPVFVVEVTPLEHVDSDYSRFVVYIDRDHYVPLRTRYWDDRSVEVKELRADPNRIEAFQGVHVPMASVMRNLRLETFTRLEIVSLEPNPKLPRSTFDMRRLESH